MKFKKKAEPLIPDSTVAVPVVEGEPIVTTMPLPDVPATVIEIDGAAIMPTSAGPRLVTCLRCGVRRQSYVDGAGVLRCTVCETARVGAR